MLLNEAGNEFDEERIAKGELTPVFFGSALTNFGVQTFLEHFYNLHQHHNLVLQKMKLKLIHNQKSFQGLSSKFKRI